MTKHTHTVVFGRKVSGCPRCSELSAGAPPVVWNGARRAERERVMVQDVRAHFASHRHVSGGCGPVCTFGD